jgi:hypothetical protein
MGDASYAGSEQSFMNGAIDEVMIFNRSLSVFEIQELYVKGRAFWNYTDYTIYQNLSAIDSNDNSSTNLFNLSLLSKIPINSQSITSAIS